MLFFLTSINFSCSSFPPSIAKMLAMREPAEAPPKESTLSRNLGPLQIKVFATPRWYIPRNPHPANDIFTLSTSRKSRSQGELLCFFPVSGEVCPSTESEAIFPDFRRFFSGLRGISPSSQVSPLSIPFELSSAWVVLNNWFLSWSCEAHLIRSKRALEM